MTGPRTFVRSRVWEEIFITEKKEKIVSVYFFYKILKFSILIRVIKFFFFFLFGKKYVDNITCYILRIFAYAYL